MFKKHTRPVSLSLYLSFSLATHIIVVAVEYCPYSRLKELKQIPPRHGREVSLSKAVHPPERRSKDKSV